MKITIQEIQTHTVAVKLNWTDFLIWNLHNIPHIDENETIAFDISGRFGVFLREIMEANDSTKRTVANYLVWRLVLMTSEFLNDDLRQRFHQFEATKYGVRKMRPRSIECAKKTMKLYENN